MVPTPLGQWETAIVVTRVPEQIMCFGHGNFHVDPIYNFVSYHKSIHITSVAYTHNEPQCTILHVI